MVDDRAAPLPGVGGQRRAGYPRGVRGEGARARAAGKPPTCSPEAVALGTKASCTCASPSTTRRRIFEESLRHRRAVPRPVPRGAEQQLPGDARGHALHEGAGDHGGPGPRRHRRVLGGAQQARPGRGAQPRPLHPRRGEPHVRPAGPHPRDQRRLRLGHALPRRPGARAVVDENGRRLDSPARARSSSTSRGGPRTSSGARARASSSASARRWSRWTAAARSASTCAIHKIDPLDRSFWPFPDRPLVVDESKRPPGPGEEPPRKPTTARATSRQELQQHLATLGSPPVSALVTLPLKREGQRGRLRPRPGAAPREALRRGQAGHLPGRPAPASTAGSDRSWMRVQVTDLSLSDARGAARRALRVTSLSTGRRSRARKVRVEGTLTTGEQVDDAGPRVTTDATAASPGTPPGSTRTVAGTSCGGSSCRRATTCSCSTRRAPPDGYADNQWSPSRDDLAAVGPEPLDARGRSPSRSATSSPSGRSIAPRKRSTSRATCAAREQGALTPAGRGAGSSSQGRATSSGATRSRSPTAGSFYHKFKEKTADRHYTAHFEDEDARTATARVAFQMEAYRLPSSRCSCTPPTRSPLDQEFDVALTASYYAGGRVAAQPVAVARDAVPLRVDAGEARGLPLLVRRPLLGQRALRVDAAPGEGRRDRRRGRRSRRPQPRHRADRAAAQLRRRGDRDRRRRPDRHRHEAASSRLPPFVLGLKVPRYLERAKRIDAESSSSGRTASSLAGQEVTVRLLHRRVALAPAGERLLRRRRALRDRRRRREGQETKVKSGAEPLAAEAADRAGGRLRRRARGARPARPRAGRGGRPLRGRRGAGDLAKPVDAVFSVATDKDALRSRSDRGDRAEEPVPERPHALAVVEAPEGNRYRWVAVAGRRGHLPAADPGRPTRRACRCTSC